MQTDYLIIGQGICGTFLSYCLLKAGEKILVIDESNPYSASKAASGLINPVTGRRVVTTWLIDELLPYAWKAYNELEKEIDAVIIEEKNMLVFPTTPEMLQAYQKRIDEENSYIHEYKNELEKLNQHFNYPFKIISIAPCYLINLNLLLSKWREKLRAKNILLEEKFNEAALQVFENSIQYKNISAKKIIYCNGIASFESKYWKNLPFVANKGQVLITNIPALNHEYIYKFASITLSSWNNEQWWVGSSNELNFESTAPTDEFKQRTFSSLQSILKIPFTIEEHAASVRPATIERRPFVGLHPQCSSIGILNGMGAKGCALAPWFAEELTQHLLQNKIINKEADVKRFSKVLSK